MSARPEGMVVWLTGLPASGKSTVARQLLDDLQARGAVTMWLDSDDLRRVLTPEPTFTDAERDTFYDALGYVAALSAQGGAIVVVSATAPRRLYREQARARVSRFLEVYLRCPERVRRARDVKGLYAGHDDGRITALPGLGSPYEAPTTPDLELDSAHETPEALAARVLSRLGETACA